MRQRRGGFGGITYVVSSGSSGHREDTGVPGAWLPQRRRTCVVDDYRVRKFNVIGVCLRPMKIAGMDWRTDRVPYRRSPMCVFEVQSLERNEPPSPSEGARTTEPRKDCMGGCSSLCPRGRDGGARHCSSGSGRGRDASDASDAGARKKDDGIRRGRSRNGDAESGSPSTVGTRGAGVSTIKRNKERDEREEKRTRPLPRRARKRERARRTENTNARTAFAREALRHGGDGETK